MLASTGSRSDSTSSNRRAEEERPMTKIIFDGIEVDVPAEYTLLQACEVAS